MSRASAILLLFPLLLSAQRAGQDLGAVDPAMALDQMTLMLKPAAGLEAFLAEQQNPASANYHRWLTPEQFGDRFGLSANDIAKVVDWLQGEGFRVGDVARGRHWITFSGNAGQVARSLGTQLHRYRAGGMVHYAPATPPVMPAALGALVTAVRGLDDFGWRPMNVEGPQFNSGSSHYLAPDDVATIYNIAPLYAAGIDGTGQKIAVIGQTEINLSDIRSFRARFGLPLNDPQLVLFGADPGIRSSDLPEADLDIEWAGAVARNATIVYVYSRSVETSAQYAVDQNLATVMTMSYGGCELEDAPGFRSVAQQANAQGITWMVSSGDSGAATCDAGAVIPQATKGPTVSFPASIPEVTAVGGTEFAEGSGTYWSASNSASGASALSPIPEVAWNDSVARSDLEGSGGGASAFYAKPLWQSGPGVPDDHARDSPDVSFSSSAIHDGYEVTTSGATHVYGGTSVASPVFAGMVALLNQAAGAGQGLGNINPVLYRLARSSTGIFHDVTGGDNKVPCQQASPGCVNGLVGFGAGAGYDLATGLGSVDAYQLVKGWNQAITATSTTLVSDVAHYNLGDTVRLTATVSPGTPSGTVTFLANDLVIGTADLSASNTAAAAVAANLVFGATGAVSAVYNGDSNFAGSAGTITLALNLPTDGSSLVVPSVTPNPVVQGLSGWPYTVKLTEKAGVATKLTGFTISGVTQSLASWTATSIPAGGSVSASLSATSTLVAPIDRVFVFTGLDDSGQTWTQQLTVPFVKPLTSLLIPAMTLTATPATVQRNAAADDSCVWSQGLTLHETGGFLEQLSSFTSGSTRLTPSLSQIFGTTRLAPYGTLQGTVCWNSSTAPGTRSYTLTGLSDLGTTVSAAATAALAASADHVSSFSVAPAALNFSGSGAAGVQLSLDAAAKWTATIVPVGHDANWLAASAGSGTGPGSVTLTASSAGLSNGVYLAMLSLQAMDSTPQTMTVPVALLVGGASGMSISGATNGATFQTMYAPGMIMSVFGARLAPTTQINAKLPLPLSMQGVSATVNGVTAPLYFISPAQLNIQIPYETSAGPAVLGVNNNGVVAAYPFTVTSSAPGIFSDAALSLVPYNAGQPGDILLAYVTGEGDVTPTLATGASPSSSTALANLPVPRAPVSLTVGGVQANILFAGIPPFLVGLIQINFQVPAGIAAGPQPVVVTVGGKVSAPVTLLVGPGS